MQHLIDLTKLHQVVYVIDMVTMTLVYCMKDDRYDGLVFSILDVIETGSH